MEHKTYKIFDAEDFARLTKGIKIAQCMRTDTSIETRDDSELAGRLEELGVSERLFCSCCNASFEDSAGQRRHYKLDWHRYNLKRRLVDGRTLTEDNFSRLADQDDVSSISGSESESEEETDDADTGVIKADGRARPREVVPASRHSKVFFENADADVFSIYRCLLHGKKEAPEKDELLVPLALKVVARTKWAIIMLGGGHFAAGIFEGREVVAHKTFHCYTVRKGQGGTQSARDGRSGGSHPKSAGASLRRYNEAALLQHVQEVTAAWAGDLATCDLVFCRATGRNSAVLFGGRNPPLAKTDGRLRSVPFPTRRATFSEVRRVHEVVATLQVYGSADAFRNSFPQPPARKRAAKPATPEEPASPGSVPTVETDGRRAGRARGRMSPVRPLPDIVAHLVAMSSDGEACHDDLGYSDEPYVSFTTRQQVEPGDCHREFDDTVSGPVTKDPQGDSELELEDPASVPVTKAPPKEKRPKKKKVKKEAKFVDRRPEMVALRKNLLAACSSGDDGLLTRSLSPVVGEAISSDDLIGCLNETVDDRDNRLLHLAARGGHSAILRTLMEAGSDPSMKNKMGHPPYVSSLDKETRNTFRRFLAEFPDKYDYTKSLIPGGLTDDLLKDQAEKKRTANKAKRDRIKQKKGEDEARRAEQSERDRFLQLTDREKRALAAERRILSETARGGGPTVVVARCFLCAADISGRVPFEYDIHRFCSIVCLKSHRMMHKS